MVKSDACQVAWAGDLILADHCILNDLQFHSSTNSPVPDTSGIPTGPLRFLAFVDPNRVPLHIAIGHNYRVTSNSTETLQWLLDTFQSGLASLGDESLLFHAQCRIAVLAKSSPNHNDDPNEEAGHPRMTEILLYAMKSGYDDESSRTDTLQGYDMFALPLSSDLLYDASTYREEDHPRSFQKPHESADSQGRDKERLDNLFDAASDRRKKAKRRSGGNIAIATSRSNETLQSPNFDSLSNNGGAAEDDSNSGQSQNPHRSLHRESGRVESLRVALTAVAPSKATSQANIAGPTKEPIFQSDDFQQDRFEDTSIEMRNRQAISRTVMAGMRIYGLQQAKQIPRRSQTQPEVQAPQFALESQALVDGPDILHDEINGEYKGVYHQVYKGVAFAMRRQIQADLLSPDAIREVVDKLLAIFCQP